MENLKILDKTFDFVKWYFAHTEKFPKSKRFSVAVRVENNLLDVLENLVHVAVSKERLGHLVKINEILDVVRILTRLCFEMKFINVGSYEYAAKQIDEIGKMTGGWIRTTKDSVRQTG